MTIAAATRAETNPEVSPGAPAPVVDLSVIIVSWNTREILRGCLSSLFQGGLSGIENFEVHVVDNCSDDGSAEMVHSEFTSVRLTANTINVGFARANNLALGLAAGRYHLLLNSDTIVPTGALARLIEVMETRPDAAVCSPLLLNDDGSPQFCWARFPALREEILGNLDRGQSPYQLREFDSAVRRAEMKPFTVDWVGGACYLVRAAAAKKSGAERLDDAFFMYSEETDWCRRFRDAGAVTLLAPSVTVTHLGGRSSQRVPVETLRRLYASRLRLYRLLYGPLGALPVCAVATARYLLSRLKSRLGRRAT